MASSLDAPKIFISYSWKPEINRQKTIALAERMESEGVHVIIDVWNLEEGQDKYQFMEQMVNDPEVKKVLVICNKEYTEKANQKVGGVGTESLIISNEVYNNADQTKFIPIIFERDLEGKEYVPTFISSRIYIDLSSDASYEEEYEKLMRNIFGKPASSRPPRGNPPAYIEQTDSVYLRTSNKIRAIQNSLVNEKKNSQILIDEYYSIFIDALADFEINSEDVDTYIDDIVVQRIDELKVLRDDFISFLEIITTYDFNFEKFITFLENLIAFTLNRNSLKYPDKLNQELMTDQYKFFFYELFLYITSILIEKGRIEELGLLLHYDFIFFSERLSNLESYSYLQFNQHAESLDKIRKDRLQTRRVSVTADLIKQRADNPKYPFQILQEHDTLLYFIGLMRTVVVDPWRWQRWFPKTTAYHVYNIPIVQKMASQRHFEKVKPLFEVNTVAELRAKIEKITIDNSDKIQRFDFEFPYINHAFDFTKIGTYK